MSKQYRYDIPVAISGTVMVTVEAPNFETAKDMAQDIVGDYEFPQLDNIIIDAYGEDDECFVEEVKPDDEPESSLWCMVKIQRFGNEISHDVTEFRFASDAQKAFDEYVSLINAVFKGIFKGKGSTYSSTYSNIPYQEFVISNTNNDYVRVYITRKAIENENHS